MTSTEAKSYKHQHSALSVMLNIQDQQTRNANTSIFNDAGYLLRHKEVQLGKL